MTWLWYCSRNSISSASFWFGTTHNTFFSLEMLLLKTSSKSQKFHFKTKTSLLDTSVFCQCLSPKRRRSLADKRWEGFFKFYELKFRHDCSSAWQEELTVQLQLLGCNKLQQIKIWSSFALGWYFHEWSEVEEHLLDFGPGAWSKQ